MKKIVKDIVKLSIHMEIESKVLLFSSNGKKDNGTLDLFILENALKLSRVSIII